MTKQIYKMIMYVVRLLLSSYISPYQFIKNNNEREAERTSKRTRGKRVNLYSYVTTIQYKQGRFQIN